MYAAQVGRITMTRFAYGVPIFLDRFDPGAGNIIVLNTIRIRENLGSHPAAERLLRNLLRFAGQ